MKTLVCLLLYAAMFGNFIMASASSAKGNYEVAVYHLLAAILFVLLEISIERR